MIGQQFTQSYSNFQRSPSGSQHAGTPISEVWRGGSPSASPAGHPAAGAPGVDRHPPSPAGPTVAGGSSSQAAQSVAGASDISRVSVESHHSCVSHRSRWSTAATVATTVAPNAARHHDPSPLPEELSGGSSGEATPVATAAGSSTHGGTMSAAGAAPGGSNTSRVQRVASLPRHGAGSSRANSRSGRSAAGTGPLPPPTGEAAAAGSTSGMGTLPPRLIVFHPDGESFGIGVDKAREAELQAAAAAAAQHRRRQQHRVAVEVLGPGGARPPRGGGPAPDDDGFTSSYAGYRQIYLRQKIALVALLITDVVYLAVLLILRLAWGRDMKEPNLSKVARFFVGSHPQNTSISYLAGSMFTDVIALYGAIQDYPSIVTLFIVWSVVLGAFAVLEMPLLFMILRLMLLIAAFQLRFSMARIRHMLPPSSLTDWLATVGRGVAYACGAVWGTVSRPFRRLAERRRSQQQQQQQQQRSGAVAAGAVSRQASGRQQPSALPGSGTTAAELAPAGSVASQLAAVRSSALFRAALLRMVAEQQGQERERGQEPDLEGGVASGDERPASAADTTPGASQTSGQRTGTAVGSQRGAGAGEAAAALGSSSTMLTEQDRASLERLYGRIMQDIAAVAATPRTSSARRRQRRHERETRRRAITASSSGGTRRHSGSGGGNNQDLNSADEGSSSERVAAPAMNRSASGGAPASSSGNAATTAGISSRQQAAVTLAAAAAQGSVAGSGGGGGPPSWQTWPELVALISYHLQQQRRRQQAQQQQIGGGVPLVSLEAPPPLDASGS